MREAAKPPISAWRTQAGSAPALEANSKCFRHRLDVQRDDDLVGDLGDLAGAGAATRVMFLPISSNRGLTLLNTSSCTRRT